LQTVCRYGIINYRVEKIKEEQTMRYKLTEKSKQLIKESKCEICGKTADRCTCECEIEKHQKEMWKKLFGRG